MTREEAIKVLSSYDVNGVWADVDGKPYNAEEQAEAFDMASDEQASLLNNLADIYQADFPHFCLQLGCVCGEFEDDYSEVEQKKVVRMLKTMVEYFDRRGEDE